MSTTFVSGALIANYNKFFLTLGGGVDSTCYPLKYGRAELRGLQSSQGATSERKIAINAFIRLNKTT